MIIQTNPASPQRGTGFCVRAAVAGLFCLASGAVLADPGGDAPETFEEAVLISPGATYTGTFELPADVDYYKFRVEQGQDIAIDCDQVYHTSPGDVGIPCIARLLDPSGVPGEPSPSSPYLSSNGAEAGEWRLEVDGTQLNDHEHSVYHFTVSVSNSAQSGAGGGSGGGAFGFAVSLLLGAFALLRQWFLPRTRDVALESSLWIRAAALLLGTVLLTGCEPGNSVGAGGNFKAPDQRPPANDLPETGLQGQVPLADQLSGRSAQGYRRGLRLVGLNDLMSRGGNHQMAWLDDCAYVTTGSRYQGSDDSLQKGLAIIDAADPQNPQLVNFIESQVWANPGNSTTTNERRHLLAGTQHDGLLEIYDATDCRNPVLMSSLDLKEEIGGFFPGNALRISADGQTAYAALCCRFDASNDPIEDVVDDPPAKNLIVVNLADLAHPTVTLGWAAFVNADSDNADLFGVDLSPDGTRAYVTLEGNHHIPHAVASTSPAGLMILDTSDIQRRDPNPQIRIISQLHWTPNETFGMAHSPQLIHIKSKPYVLVTDVSFSGSSGDCPWSYARLIDISDEKNPQIASVIKLEVNELGHCSQAGPDGVSYSAYQSAVDDLNNATTAFFSWEGSGLRVFDIRDPSQPKEIAYYNPPAHPIPDPQTGLPTKGSDKFDRTTSSIRYDRNTGHIWFSSTNNGFQIVELTSSTGAVESP